MYRGPSWAWRVSRFTISANSRSLLQTYLRIGQEYHTVILDHIPVMKSIIAMPRSASSS